MTVLSPSKSSYMLDIAGLDLLHEQSRDWVSEIAFWRIEANFFYSLIIKKTIKPVPLKAKSLLKKIENDLISITINELDKLEQEINTHDKFLSYLLKNKNHQEETYRKKHRELAQTFVHFEKRFKALKNEVFEIIELIATKKIENENLKLEEIY